MIEELAARRKRIVAVAVALLNFPIATVNKMLDELVFRNIPTPIEGIVLGVMRGERFRTSFGLVFPAMIVGVINGVNTFLHKCLC